MNAQPDSVVLLGILEKQLRLFRDLSADLVASRTAYVAMNLDRMYEHIAAQAAICDRLRQIDHERKSAWSAACAAHGLNPDAGDLSGLLARIDPKTAESMREVVTKLALAEGELRNLNRAHTVLIEGSRRTLAILGNVLASFAPTYSRPANASDSAAAIWKGAAQ